ncbi:tubby C 2 family protein [[Clostridium] bifermentans ATCC 638]|uniref:Tubby C 2 family protein n=1 Tax=Paraclostridium bifermentans ATCC 638 = DSM 14991 TaxID=1233171 RepID=T4VRQ0_PARBF|nr:LURP-one-related family protein [Paraclostridium bifermentans]EQK43367.1 tubby C 2 family protein [[Clostridium] bifermentans ATCC 638] [Paraclostridium bifermentans ATCC 638 = DSM 14991]UAG17225.1 LURP-one-related family protein [Paraclostridium bifermentans]
MRYHMKSKLFKLKEDFWIKNDKEEDAFFVDNKLISVGLQFKMMKDNKTLYEVKQKLALLPKYEVMENSEVVATLNKKLTFIKDRMTINCKYGELTVNGNLFDRKYKIYKENKEIADIKKDLFKLTDGYTIDINFEDEAFILTLIVIIDDILDKH